MTRPYVCLRHSLFTGMALFVLRPAHAQLTQISIHRDAYVSTGSSSPTLDLVYNNQNATIQSRPSIIFAPGKPDDIVFSYQTPLDPLTHRSDFGELEFSSEGLNAGLTTGLYDDAERAGFGDAGHAGLDVSGSYGGFNELHGSFNILALTLDNTDPLHPVITNFAVTFTEYGDNIPAPLVGSLYYNYTLSAVPEANSLLLMGGLLGAGGLALRRSRRTRTTPAA